MSQPPETGATRWIQDNIRSVLAPNPSPMTYWGTNSFLIGRGEVAVLDPGPANPDHISALLDALDPNESITKIILTHSHLDHSAAVTALVQETGAKVIAFGDSLSGRRNDTAQLADLGGGEGRDLTFKPDQSMGDEEVLEVSDWKLRAIWTPGHMGNHLCFALDDILFSGDHVMDWATSMVSPPDGDLSDFMLSLEKLMGRGFSKFLPAHGLAVSDPEGRLQELYAHRKGREQQILSAVADRAATAKDLAERIYTDIPPALLLAAARNVLAHLIDLSRRGLVTANGGIRENAKFTIV